MSSVLRLADGISPLRGGPAGEGAVEPGEGGSEAGRSQGTGPEDDDVPAGIVP